jgi:hypothetical protein
MIIWLYDNKIYDYMIIRFMIIWVYDNKIYDYISYYKICDYMIIISLFKTAIIRFYDYMIII